MIDTALPYPDMQRVSLVNERARAAGDAAEFSTQIRQGLPAPRPYTMDEFLNGY
jgi:hypothetical protein